MQDKKSPEKNKKSWNEYNGEKLSTSLSFSRINALLREMHVKCDLRYGRVLYIRSVRKSDAMSVLKDHNCSQKCYSSQPFFRFTDSKPIHSHLCVI